jgi:hypothetical protein
MNTYNRDTPCLKCWETNASSEYESALYLCDLDMLGKELRPEVIRRTCRNCGYVWDEKPIEVK